MIKICVIGLVVLFVLCMAISSGRAWGALVFELLGFVWLMFCFNKFDS